MPKRERLEDLGRMHIIAENLSNHEIFNLYHGRRKDIHDWWSHLDEERRGDFLHSIAYGLEDVSEKLAEICLLGKGDDDLV